MPSRGLVTRLPSESADLFRKGDTERTFAVAQQVRFEDGVVCAAPGYERVTISGTPGVSLVTAANYTQPAIGASVVVTFTANPVTAGVIVGAYLQILDSPSIDEYLVTAVSASPFQATLKLVSIGGTNGVGSTIFAGASVKTANLIDGPIIKLHQGNLLNPSWLLDANVLADQSTPLVAATKLSLYSIQRSYDSVNAEYSAEFTRLFTGIPADLGVPWFTSDFGPRIIFAQRSNVPQTWVSGDPNTNPLPGLPTTDSLWDGVIVFFEHTVLWRGDRLKWSDVDDFTNYIPVGSTAATFVLTTSSTATQPALGGSVTFAVHENPVALGVTVGQYIRISAEPSYSFYQVTAVTTTSVTVTLQSLTGSIAPGTVFATNTQILSVDANEAGETQVTGSDTNGPILNVIRLGDYAYIFKSRSIQSLQYVGLGSGIFFVHTEITNEGLISPQAVINLGDGRLVFFGHRELYQYQGGPTPTAICQQVTRQVYAELDRGRLDEILLYHNESRKEVWLHYPISGGRKVLIWNYIEDTATFDVVTPALNSYTALDAADWSSDVRWLDLADDLTWDLYDPTITWEDLSSGTVDHLTLIGSGDSFLHVHGFRYTQDGVPYTALAESMDFDFGDRDLMKYVDLVTISAQVKVTTDTPQLLYLQIGYKSNFDDAITWTKPLSVNVQGNATGYPIPPTNLIPAGTTYPGSTTYTLSGLTPAASYIITFNSNEVALTNGPQNIFKTGDGESVTFMASGSSVTLFGIAFLPVTATLVSAAPANPVFFPLRKVNPGGAGRYIRLRMYSQDANVQWRVSSFEIYARRGGTY